MKTLKLGPKLMDAAGRAAGRFGQADNADQVFVIQPDRPVREWRGRHIGQQAFGLAAIQRMRNGMGHPRRIPVGENGHEGVEIGGFQRRQAQARWSRC